MLSIQKAKYSPGNIQKVVCICLVWCVFVLLVGKSVAESIRVIEGTNTATTKNASRRKELFERIGRQKQFAAQVLLEV